MTTQPGLAAAHPGIAAYALQQGLDASAFRTDGRLTLRVDGRYRVHLRRVANGRIAITARLMSLNEHSAAAAEELLLRLSAMGAGLLRAHDSGLCIDEVEQALQLQLQLPADTDGERLEAEMERYLNALTFWTRACAAEPSGVRA
ncbi:MAG: CesT family type III secretion system chaperone [Ramlibacter sp.]